MYSSRIMNGFILGGLCIIGFVNGNANNKEKIVADQIYNALKGENGFDEMKEIERSNLLSALIPNFGGLDIGKQGLNLNNGQSMMPNLRSGFGSYFTRLFPRFSFGATNEVAQSSMPRNVEMADSIEKTVYNEPSSSMIPPQTVFFPWNLPSQNVEAVVDDTGSSQSHTTGMPSYAPQPQSQPQYHSHILSSFDGLLKGQMNELGISPRSFSQMRGPESKRIENVNTEKTVEGTQFVDGSQPGIIQDSLCQWGYFYPDYTDIFAFANAMDDAQTCLSFCTAQITTSVGYAGFGGSSGLWAGICRCYITKPNGIPIFNISNGSGTGLLKVNRGYANYTESFHAQFYTNATECEVSCFVIANLLGGGNAVYSWSTPVIRSLAPNSNSNINQNGCMQGGAAPAGTPATAQINPITAAMTQMSQMAASAINYNTAVRSNSKPRSVNTFSNPSVAPMALGDPPNCFCYWDVPCEPIYLTVNSVSGPVLPCDLLWPLPLPQ